MITKTEATALFNTFKTTLPQRVNAAIESAARSGQVSLAFVYAPADVPNIAALQTYLTANGWTSVDDAPNRTLTIS